MKQETSKPQLIEYGTDQENFGVLRVPAGNGPHPVVILVHGGMWLDTYSLDYLEPMSKAITEAGIAAWSIEYRRIGNGGGFPTTFQDLARAVDHLRTLAPKFNFDLQRVAIVGHSAGAQLALWAAARPRIAKGKLLYETAKDALAVRAAISLAGALDLNALAEHKIDNGSIEKLLGGTRAQLPERYAAVSPIEMVPLGVPQILIHGTEDKDVPFDISKNYHAAATAKGDRVTLTPLRGSGHFELVNPRTAEWKEVLMAIQAALK